MKVNDTRCACLGGQRNGRATAGPLNECVSHVGSFCLHGCAIYLIAIIDTAQRIAEGTHHAPFRALLGVDFS